MSTLPATGDFDVGNVADNDEAAALHEAVRAVVEELLGGADEEALSLASDVIIPTKASVVVDSEDANPDTLSNATQTNHDGGKYLAIRCADAARPITIEHLGGGGGEFYMVDGEDLVLEDPDEVVLFIRRANRWEEVFRSTQNRVGRVLEVTEVLASPKVLVASDNGKYLRSDPAAAARNYATLPPAVAGMSFPFGCDSAQGMRLTADGTDRIQRRGTTSAAGGYYETPAEDGFQGELFCWKTGQWVVRFEEGAGAGAVT